MPRILKRMSTFIGVLSVICVIPALQDLLDRLEHGRPVGGPALVLLATVAVLYGVTRYAESKMRQ
jgi:hypothetical protein